MKYLCICERGNSRSVCLAFILKEHLGQDALSMGITAVSEETRDMLMKWADHILLCDKTFEPLIPKRYKKKLKIFDVGPDRYFRGYEEDLIRQYVDYINIEAAKGEPIV